MMQIKMCRDMNHLIVSMVSSHPVGLLAEASLKTLINVILHTFSNFKDSVRKSN